MLTEKERALRTEKIAALRRIMDDGGVSGGAIAVHMGDTYTAVYGALSGNSSRSLEWWDKCIKAAKGCAADKKRQTVLDRAERKRASRTVGAIIAIGCINQSKIARKMGVSRQAISLALKRPDVLTATWWVSCERAAIELAQAERERHRAAIAGIDAAIGAASAEVPQCPQ